MIWLLIGVMALITVGVKAAGPLLAGGREPSERVTRVISFLAPAFIAALVVVGTFTHGSTLVVDARAAGVGVGLTALLLRAPLAFALILGAATCALLRLYVG